MHDCGVSSVDNCARFTREHSRWQKSVDECFVGVEGDRLFKSKDKNTVNTEYESSTYSHECSVKAITNVPPYLSYYLRPQEPMPETPTKCSNERPKHFKIKTQLTRGLWRNSTIWLVQRGLYNKISTIGIMSMSSLIGSDRCQKRDTRGEWRFW